MPYGILTFKNINTKNNDLTLYVNNNKFKEILDCYA